ncbi:S8 family serine peptidase [Paenibacillus sp. SC116]|uniref:S8 family serine peptidase n=1 Tax=Paenibacillus sp. SC116 TaxID=2968986 RepID=UPI00215A9067|nr:S8 family serine peptidase [Paenibacillus sp. SC116]MCR8843541.1 S8 family serine peptidase [Paenibacillus sp. SC116]
MRRITHSKKIIVTSALAVSMTVTSLFGMTTVQAAPSGFSENHISTGSNILSQQYTGKGIKVAVIDSGINMEHPLFKGNIKKGYDYLDQDSVPQDETGHGSHVAGIIMQQAPDAELHIYRVFGGVKGQTNYSHFVVDAIQRAVQDKVQVINLSLNADIDAPGEPIARAVAEAVKQGVVVVKSAGNNGEDWSITSPGYGAEPIVVGATSQSRTDAALVTRTTKIQLHPLYGAKMLPTTGPAAFIYAGNVAPEKLKDAKYRGKYVIIEASEDSDYFVEDWYPAAQQAGIKGIILAVSSFDEDGSTTYVNVDKDPSRMIPGAIIPMKDAHKLKKLASKSWSWSSVNVAERLGSLSSRGPAVGTWLLKPDLVAPGMHIYSSLASEDAYGLNSGTSMAAPQVTAAAALLLEAHPDWTPDMVKSALMQHANQLVNEKGIPYKRTEQGAGSLNVEAALQTNTFAAPASLSFGQIAPGYKGNNPVLSQTLELKNTSPKPVTYELEAIMETGKGHIDIPQQITVQPNQMVKIPVKWTVDVKQKAGIWSGAISIKGDKDVLSVPFVLVNQVKSYPLVQGTYIDNTMYAPKGDSSRKSSTIHYYVTVPSQRVLVTATREDEQPKSLAGKTYVLLNQANHAKGLTPFKFTGIDMNGTVLPDGHYTIKVKSFAEHRQTVAEGTSIFIDSKAPVMTINQQKAAKGQLFGKLEDQLTGFNGLIVTKELESNLIFDPKLITMQWRVNDKQKWNYVNVNVDEKQFFADLRSAKLAPGKHTIVLRAKDVFGNQAERTTEVTIK